MAESVSSDLSALIQVQQSKPSPARWSASKSTEGSSQDNDLAGARDAAEQFEALLIHNMLKAMRKTTMADDTSNQKALYDDMLDQQLADTLIDSGGIGIADQLMSQLQPGITTNQAAGTVTPEQKRSGPVPERSSQMLTMTQDLLRLRELAQELVASRPTASPEERRTEFLEPLRPHADSQAARLGTSPNAILAIAALETGWGQSMLTDAVGDINYNYFGIKAGNNDTQVTRNTTTEFVNGRAQKIQASFKSFNNAADAVRGFADFILENPRYSTALQHASNPDNFLRELHKAGYATDPQYADKAIKVLRQVELHTAQP